MMYVPLTLHDPSPALVLTVAGVVVLAPRVSLPHWTAGLVAAALFPAVVTLVFACVRTANGDIFRLN